MCVPRMRTLPETAAELKRLDNNTAVTLTALRRMVKQGVIPSVSVGKKRLVCLDTVLDMFQCAPLSNAAENGKIRRIEKEGI